jgi:hypothetical protein
MTTSWSPSRPSLGRRCRRIPPAGLGIVPGEASAVGLTGVMAVSYAASYHPTNTVLASSSAAESTTSTTRGGRQRGHESGRVR